MYKVHIFLKNELVKIVRLVHAIDHIQAMSQLRDLGLLPSQLKLHVQDSFQTSESCIILCIIFIIKPKDSTNSNYKTNTQNNANSETK